MIQARLKSRLEAAANTIKDASKMTDTYQKQNLAGLWLVYDFTLMLTQFTQQRS
jgi:hypothetical protein